MDIEAIVKKFSGGFLGIDGRSAQNILRAALTELAAGYEKQLEVERMRLAACGVIAMSNKAESAAKARQMLPEYWSASAKDCANAVDREMALQERIRQLSETHAIELRAYEATVQNMESRIRQMEAERVPEGWVIDRANDEIIIRNHEIGGCVVQRSPTESRVIPESILWELANAMLAAAPAKEDSRHD